MRQRACLLLARFNQVTILDLIPVAIWRIILRPERMDGEASSPIQANSPVLI